LPAAEIARVPLQRPAGWRKGQVLRRAERDRQHHGQRGHKEDERRDGEDDQQRVAPAERAGRFEAERSCPARHVRVAPSRHGICAHRRSARVKRWTTRSKPAVIANSTTASAEPSPQSRSWLIWLSISIAIIMSRRPPSSAGVTKKPSAL